MQSAGSADKSLRDVIPGAQVAHQGMTLGSVERVVTDERTGEPEAILVRHGRADYLLRVPARYVHADSAARVEVDDSVELDEIERTAVASGRTPPSGEHITSGGATEAADKAEGLISENDVLPDSYDGPATG